MLHTDAVQAVAWMDLSVAPAPPIWSASAATSSAAPRAWACWRPGAVAAGAIIHGGGQERELRSGTHNVAGDRRPGCGRRRLGAERPAGRPRVRALRDDLGPAAARPSPTPSRRRPAGRERPAICHLRFPGRERGPAGAARRSRGVCLGRARPAPAAPWSRAMSCWPWASPRTEALRSLRLTLGPTTTAAPTWTLPPQRSPARSPGCGAAERCGSWWPCPAGWTRRWPPPLLVEAGHDVVGATMKLWGGPSDTGCCSVADVDDARRVAQQLGIDHHVFNFTEDFERDVVESLRGRPRRGPHAEPVRRLQPASQVRPLLDAGGPARLRRRRHRSPRPGAAEAGTHGAAARGGPGQGPVLRAAHARPGRSWPGCCFPSAS